LILLKKHIIIHSLLFCRRGGTCLSAGRLVDIHTTPLTMFIVCIIKSLVKNYNYKGLTNNIERRLEEHNSGKNKTTKPYRPFKLIHQKEFKTRSKAREYEKFLKSSEGRSLISKTISKN